MGTSQGTHTGGRDEPRDVVAAIDALAAAVEPGTPIHLQGWSFGALMALAVADPRVASWFAVAPPLGMGVAASPDAVAADPRPKLVAVGRHDRAVDPERLQALVGTWANARVVVIEGTDHFFAGHTGELVELAADAAGAGAAELAGQLQRLHHARSHEEVALAAQHRLPLDEVAIEAFTIAVFVGVLELVERGGLRIEHLAVPPEESLVEGPTVPVRVGHGQPFACGQGSR